jgi:hypothetical protein
MLFAKGLDAPSEFLSLQQPIQFQIVDLRVVALKR